MVSYVNSRTISYSLNQQGKPVSKTYIEYYCLSTDTKPSGAHIANGSVLLEMDTGTVYFWDEAGSTWRAWA